MHSLVGFLSSPPTAESPVLILTLESAAAGAAFAARRGRPGRAPFGDRRADGSLDVRVSLPARHRAHFVRLLSDDSLRGALLCATVRVRGWTVRNPGFASVVGFSFDLAAVTRADGTPIPSLESAPVETLDHFQDDNAAADCDELSR
jgi:hypothetical protein